MFLPASRTRYRSRSPCYFAYLLRFGATPQDAEHIIAVPALLGVLGRLLATEDDYDSGAECHWCQTDSHTDGCPGEEAKALEARLGAGAPPPQTQLLDAVKTAIERGYGGEHADWCTWESEACDCGLSGLQDAIGINAAKA